MHAQAGGRPEEPAAKRNIIQILATMRLYASDRPWRKQATPHASSCKPRRPNMSRCLLNCAPRTIANRIAPKVWAQLATQRGQGPRKAAPGHNIEGAPRHAAKTCRLPMHLGMLHIHKSTRHGERKASVPPALVQHMPQAPSMRGYARVSRPAQSPSLMRATTSTMPNNPSRRPAPSPSGRKNPPRTW